VLLVAAIAGVAVAALAGLAVAKSFTLTTVKNAKVTNVKGVSRRETIVGSSQGVAVYTLTHDSVQHPGCTKANGCFRFWPPVTVHSKSTKLTKAPGVKGKLGLFHRNGLFQVTLNNHPLYTFKLDNEKKGTAKGEGVPSFGGIWHVVTASGSKGGHTTTGSSNPGSYY
jgi:predicted lipoprotein with Yx(FWY)xxD motif